MDKQEMIARLNKVLQDNESMACLDAQLNEAAAQDGHDLATESIEFEKNVYTLRKAIAFIEHYFPVDEREQRWMDAYVEVWGHPQRTSQDLQRTKKAKPLLP